MYAIGLMEIMFVWTASRPSMEQPKKLRYIPIWCANYVEAFAHIHQDSPSGTGELSWLPQCQSNNTAEYGQNRLHNTKIQYIPRNMHTVFALLCFVVVIHWLIFPYPSGLLHWHCGNLTIAPVPAKQPWWIWINTSCEFIMNDCITTTKQSTTKPCAYFLGYTVHMRWCIFGVCTVYVL